MAMTGHTGSSALVIIILFFCIMIQTPHVSKSGYEQLATIRGVQYVLSKMRKRIMVKVRGKPNKTEKNENRSGNL